MDIHKPHAAKTWREFFIEIGTIVVGILIALGLEQVIEQVHWHNQVKEAEASIENEILTNVTYSFIKRPTSTAPKGNSTRLTPRWLLRAIMASLYP